MGKELTLVFLALVFMVSQATASDDWLIPYWRLTMVTRHELVHRDYHYPTRHSCIRAGIEDMQNELKPDMWGENWLGFTCEPRNVEETIK